MTETFSFGDASPICLYLMNVIFDPIVFHTVEYIMIALAVVVFVALRFITPGYGMFYTPKWGPTVGNRMGWIIMEAPVFICMAFLWACSDRAGQPALIAMASLFMFHYFQRSFIFPLLIKGKNRMPWVIILLGCIFNVVNAYLIGGWLFYVSPADTYPTSWLVSLKFIIGSLIFFIGMGINWQSDYIIRHLRKPGDHRHYIPMGGMFRYVTSANYFGEILEWVGFAILTWSLPGLIFVMWTFANLGPRARSLYGRYCEEFGEKFTSLNRKYIIPFIW